MSAQKVNRPPNGQQQTAHRRPPHRRPHLHLPHRPQRLGRGWNCVHPQERARERLMRGHSLQDCSLRRHQIRPLHRLPRRHFERQAHGRSLLDYQFPRRFRRPKTEGQKG